MSLERRVRLPKVPEFWQKESEHRRQMGQTLNAMLRGQSNNTVSIVLEPDETTTVLSDPEFTADTTLVLHPTSASGAAALASLWVEPKAGEIILHHDASAATDRSFRGVFYV